MVGGVRGRVVPEMFLTLCQFLNDIVSALGRMYMESNLSISACEYEAPMTFFGSYELVLSDCLSADRVLQKGETDRLTSVSKAQAAQTSSVGPWADIPTLTGL